MEHQIKNSENQERQPNSVPRLVLNFYSGNKIEGEAFVTDHIFSYIISGTNEIWLGDKKYTFSAGDFRLFRRNQLSRYVKSPVGGSFKSVAIHIDQATLREMSELYGLVATENHGSGGAMLIQANSQLKGFAESLLSYLQGPLDERIVALKTRELICRALVRIQMGSLRSKAVSYNKKRLFLYMRALQRACIS